MRRLASGVLIACFLIALAFPVHSSAKIDDEKRDWQDESIYFIMVDRFYNGEKDNDYEVDSQDPYAFHGGDFAGIIEKLDYIQDLGFTAIWLTPIFANEEKGYHGYWIHDFYATEKHFGTLDDFKRLVEEAHEREIKVILDFVANHVGPNHPWTKDPAKKDWFHEDRAFANWNSQTEVENGWIYGLPDLAQENEETKRYLIDVAKWWITETDIDGYRLDTVKHVPAAFWQEFSREVKSVKEDFYLIGEVWSESPHYIARYEDTGIDGFADFPLNQQLRGVFAKADRPLAPLFKQWETNKEMYEQPGLLGAFIDNHDMPRFGEGLQSMERWKLAFAYLFTQPEIPIIYYGSEVGLEGGEDPDNRRMMDFEANPELKNYVSELLSIRKSEKALTRGTMKMLYEKSGMAVFERKYEDDILIVAINNSSEEKWGSFPFEQAIAANDSTAMFGQAEIRVDNQQLELTLPAESVAIFNMSEQSSKMNAMVIGSVAIAGVLMTVVAWRYRKKKVK